MRSITPKTLSNNAFKDIPKEYFPFLCAFAIYGHGLGQTRLIELLKRQHATSPFANKIALDVLSVKAMLGNLMVAKLIHTETVGFELRPDLQWPLLDLIATEGTLNSWVKNGIN